MFSSKRAVQLYNRNRAPRTILASATVVKNACFHFSRLETAEMYDEPQFEDVELEDPMMPSKNRAQGIFARDKTQLYV